MLIVGFKAHLPNYINKKIHGGKTMKCLKNSKTGEIIRVKDKAADIATSEWKFIPKSEWKAAVRPVKKEEKESK